MKSPAILHYNINSCYTYNRHYFVLFLNSTNKQKINMATDVCIQIFMIKLGNI